jgi:hypothetical protein
MKAYRFLRALPLALLLISPARADQASIVEPTAGPKTMLEVMTAVNAAMLAIQSCNSGTSAPANGPGNAPKAYQCWADTSAAPIVSYKFYDGTSWVTIGQLNTSTHVWTPYRNGAAIAVVATSSSAADLTTGTLPAARLPVPSVSTLGGVLALTCSTSNWMRTISTAGAPGCSQPAFSDLTGSVAAAQMPALTGDVTTPAGGVVTTIGPNKVLDSMLRQSTALSLIGRSASTAGNVADISAVVGSSCAFRESASAVGCGQLATAALANSIVTNAKLAQMANGTTKCRTTAGTGDPEDCTAAQMRSLLSLVVGANVQAWDADLDAFALKTAPTGAVVGTTDTQTLPNKTLPSPVITTPTGIVKGDVGLGSVDNTSDTNKPVSTAQAAADALKVNLTRNVSTGCGLAGGGDLSADRSIRLSLTINAQTGTSYTVQDSDCSKLVSFNNASAVAVTLPPANGTTFINGWSVDFQNRGAGAATVTPTTSTINGGASLALSQNQGMHCQSDGANYTCVLGVGAGGGSGTVTQVVCGTGLSGGTITASGTCAVNLSFLTNSLSSDVSLNNTANYFSGPAVAQGNSGTWCANGSVLVYDSNATGAQIYAKLWDGVTVIASGEANPIASFQGASVALSGCITNPAGNIRIDVKDLSHTTGVMLSNASGNSKDSTLTVFRIQ